MKRDIPRKEFISKVKEYLKGINKDEFLEELRKEIGPVHPYRPDIKTTKSLREILKPTVVPFEISSIIK